MKSELGAERRSLIFKLIDRRDRMSPDKWTEWSLDEGLSQKELEALQAMLEDRETWKQSAPLTRLFEATSALGVADYIAYDPTVIRA